KKIARIYSSPGERHRAALVFLRIRNGVEQFLWVQTVSGAIIAVASWGVMKVVGLDNALFWAFLIFIVNYIPIIGPILQPRMQGKSLNIDPVVVLLALAFWGVVWGIPGMILSTPITVVMMAVLAQFSGTRWLAVLLSSDGDPLGDKKRAAAQAEREPGPAAVA